MAQSYLINLNSWCYGCMSNNDGLKLRTYLIQNGALRTIIQSNQIMLCYLCQRVAQQAEQFIHNVQQSQVWLETKKQFSDTQIQSIKAVQGIRPLVNLSSSLLSQEDIIAFSGTDEREFHLNEVKLEFEAFSETDEQEFHINEVKVEFDNEIEETQNTTKQEEENIGETIEQGCQNIAETTEQKTHDITESQVAQRHILDVSDDPLGGNSLSDVKGHESEEENLTEKKPLTQGQKIECILLTKEEFREDMNQKAKKEQYLEAPFKCVDCVRHYRMKGTYERHMELHKETKGAYKCDLCNQRMATSKLLVNHLNRHLSRFKCCKCGIVKKDRDRLNEHYRIVHEERNDNICAVCKKVFSCSATFKWHMTKVHSKEPKAKTKCPYCDQLFKNKESLPGHFLAAHSDEVLGKRHTCKICGCSYISRHLLKQHIQQTHSNTNGYYCVECDKKFKTKNSLDTHFKTTTAHLNVTDLSVVCPECGKQRATEKALQIHIKRVHGVQERFGCAHCDKSYTIKKSLLKHIRTVHDKYVRARQFPCQLCDKEFFTNSNLKAHIRTHTGEKPYKCSKCSAEFSQSSSLHTHDKLVHLGLKRKGSVKGGKVRNTRKSKTTAGSSDFSD